MRVSTLLDRDADPLVTGEPPLNLVPAELTEYLGTAMLTVCGQQVPAPSLRRHLGRRIVVGVRPEHLQDAVVGRPAAAGPAVLVFHGVVRQIRAAGAERIVRLELADAETGPPPTVVVARVSADSRATVGGPIMLAVDARHLLVYESGDGSDPPC